jgi:DNA-directed RNA polymerase subunit F
MLTNRKPLTLAATKSYITSLEERPVLHDYFKKFSKLSKDKADKLYSEVETLNNPKLKTEHMVKIVDLLPEDAEDLNKICSDVSLSEEEINAILKIVKQY